MFIKNFYYTTKYKIVKFFESMNTIFSWIPTLWKDHDFDFAFLWIIERKKIQRMKKYFETHDYIDTKEILKYINLALTLLDIMIEDKSCLVFKTLTVKDSIDEKTSLADVLLGNANWYYEFSNYVNLNNAKRFFKGFGYDETQKRIDKCKNMPYERACKEESYILDELYKEKAKHLYYKIMMEKLETWWD